MVINFRARRGLLACGYVAKGRMEEPLQIVERLNMFFDDTLIDNSLADSSFNGKQALITAGPTIEELDPVRYLSNRSSGKIGYALAESLAKRGAKVTLVSGPTHLTPPEGITFVSVQSAEDMFQAVKRVMMLKILCLKQRQFRIILLQIH